MAYNNLVTSKRNKKLTKTPATRPIPNRKEVMIKNHAGGYVFLGDKFMHVERFLIMGAMSGTYYVSKQQLGEDAMKAVMSCVDTAEDGLRLVKLIVDISSTGRAYSNSPALLALAVAASVNGRNDADEPEFVMVRTAALTALPLVARTASHLMEFVSYAAQMRGWGRSLRTAVANWYEAQPPTRLAYQVVKYRNRAGYTHRDLLRLSHPQFVINGASNVIAQWALGKGDIALTPPLIQGFERLQAATTPEQAVKLLGEYPTLPHEALPMSLAKSAAVWSRLFPTMPLTAALRNLRRMHRMGGVLNDDNLPRFIERLTNVDLLRKSMVHPMQIYLAMCMYQAEGGRNGRLMDALTEAFHLSFQNAPSSGKRILLAIDVSGSMSQYHVQLGRETGYGPSAAAAATAQALVMLNSEPNADVVLFDTGLHVSNMSPKQRLDDATRAVMQYRGGGTNCSLPFVWASSNRKVYDAIVILSDEENWVGYLHPTEALQQYRAQYNRDCKFICVAMIPGDHTLADPADTRSMNIAGFDAGVLPLISAFIGAAPQSVVKADRIADESNEVDD